MGRSDRPRTALAFRRGSLDIVQRTCVHVAEVSLVRLQREPGQVVPRPHQVVEVGAVGEHDLPLIHPGDVDPVAFLVVGVRETVLVVSLDVHRDE